MELHQAKSITDLKDVKILLVDDVKENRMVAELYLKSFKALCDTAENGQEAVDKYKARNYDLLLLDVQMPVKDGIEAMKEIRQYEEQRNGKQPYFVALTAFASKGHVESILRSGFDEYLAKPLAKKVFKACLMKCLERMDQNTSQHKSHLPKAS